MSPSRRKGSRLIWTYCSGKMEVFRALFLVAYILKFCTATPQDIENYPVTTRGYSDDYSRSSFKPSELLDYYDDRDDSSYRGGTFRGGSMQDNFLDLFIWNKPMPTTSIVNTFLENENELPFLREISQTCPRRDFFFGMNPRHMNAVTRLNEILMEQRSPEDCLKMAAGLRDRGEINPHAWLRAVISATIHRRDLQGLKKPPIVEIMPSMFIPNEALSALKRSINAPSSSRKCIRIDGTVGRDNGIENLVWYWREDVMVNSHHWYWHLSYPITGERGRQDREGELFYFMHHTMLARFHLERLSVGLPPVRPYNLQPGTRIPLGYNPHMHDGNSGNNWSARPPGVPASDIMSTALPDAPFFVSVRNRSIQLNRILDGISMGSLIDAYGQPIYLDTDEGINALGNTVEANAESVNPEYYGYHGVHNNGHNIISLSMDPRNERGLPPGVMGDAATAMRDIMFYPYHEYIDNVFNRYKNSLAPYQLTQGDWPLLMPGVHVHSVKVQSKNLPANVLHTFWSYRRYDLGRGLDFNRSFVRGPLFACHQHLDHQDFEYELKIERKEHAHRAKTVTVRLFMGPRYDLKGRRYNLEEERHFMFIMDTFTVPLKVGMNTVRRRSIETPLTIDFPASLRELRMTTENTMPFCGCGWPHHLLIPKGKRDGLSMDLFAMITNSAEDAVIPERRAPPQNCRPAYIFCGLMDEKYPDARPMGYPFDRRLYISEKGQGPAFLEHLVRDAPNMAFSHIKVVHFDEFRGGVENDFLGDGDYNDLGSNSVGHEYIDDDHSSSIGTDSPTSKFSDIIHINGGPSSFSTSHNHNRLVTSPISIESPIHIDGPEHVPGPPPGPPLPPPPPPPPRTILDLRLEHHDDSEDVTRESAPNFHSGSDSNGLDDFIPKHHLDPHESIRSAINKVNPPPPPPPPFHIHPDAHIGFHEEPLPVVKRPYRSAFRSSFRSLLKTFSPIGPMGGPPKSVLSLLG
ncbi:unnamed protein product [Orchesella dallaii]|uniref:Phenoloxidase subunit A3 n=1 Tax=Orchesella dallaii TaxID=48710 RepID=A0ABP1QC85_9HEXA